MLCKRQVRVWDTYNIIWSVLKLINTSCCITVVHLTSLLPKRLTVPVNCVRTFRLLSRIDYAIPAVSCVFAYIVILFQTPIDRDIYASIEYVQLSERGTIALVIPLHWRLCISNYIIWIRSHNCPRNRAILAAILAISTFRPLCPQSIPQYLYLCPFRDGLLVTLFLHCRTALGKMSLFTWRPLCSHITLVAVHLEVVSLLSMPIFKQTFELIQHRCTFLILYSNIMAIVIQIICDGTVSHLICWFDLTISKLLWPFEFMFSITITGSFLPCWFHSCLA